MARQPGLMIVVVAGAAVAVLAVALRATGRAEVPWVAIAYAVMSIVAFAMYGFDKRRARRGGRRIPEATLHLSEALFGWPGAFLAQQFFRHKTRKRSFLVVFWLIGIAHAAGWAWWWWSTR